MIVRTHSTHSFFSWLFYAKKEHIAVEAESLNIDYNRFRHSFLCTLFCKTFMFYSYVLVFFINKKRKKLCVLWCP